MESAAADTPPLTPGTGDTPDPRDPAAVLAALLRCPSVTPEEGGALDLLERLLVPLGFRVERLAFSEEGTPDVENLFAATGTGRHLAFAGHTDVVPPGRPEAWRFPPFSGTLEDGILYGRGAVDMKGAIAAFVAACARRIEREGSLGGRVSFLITGDEEGPGINGTAKLLEWAAARAERFDACLVGEPTNPSSLGEMVKIGRRGSLSGTVTVTGIQGHVAYPHLADNPLRAVTAIAARLMQEPLDAGTDAFPASNLEITSIDTGNEAVNIIPDSARLSFNVRFSDRWTPQTLKTELEARIAAGAAPSALRPARKPALWTVTWRDRPSEAFMTREPALRATIAAAIEAVTGRTPEFSTTGGTSDARFIKDYCPVIEFGLVGQTMHKVDEQVPLADLERLAEIYERFIAGWFAAEA